MANFLEIKCVEHTLDSNGEYRLTNCYKVINIDFIVSWKLEDTRDMGRVYDISMANGSHFHVSHQEGRRIKEFMFRHGSTLTYYADFTVSDNLFFNPEVGRD